ncbi:hypothetical protein C8A01DRAFT_39177 [Parachaetomium inaequale]|uniref:Uncharacterized protein n=1 Tax=Parachaetomium inaequale TaxID=2588326 RepID=A0AAN6PE86_9PEZI|nr:hypothetical protein C8A01DRAFT_39177 [Parachaetomium inaequale]
MCSITVNQPHPWSFHRSSSRRHHHHHHSNNSRNNNIHITCTCSCCVTPSRPYSSYYYSLSSSYPLSGAAGCGSIYNINNYTPDTTPTNRYRPCSGGNDYRGTETTTRDRNAIYCYDHHFTPRQTQTRAPRPPPRPRCRSCDRHSCRCPGRSSRYRLWEEDRRWVEDWEAWVYERERDVERFTRDLDLDLDLFGTDRVGGRRGRWWKRGLGGLGRG